MLESKFQAKLIKEIKSRLPGCIVFKHDGNYIQGIPDLAVYYKDRYAMLECKRSSDESHRPNQDYYVDLFNDMSFAAFIYPENKDEVLRDMQLYLEGSE